MMYYPPKHPVPAILSFFVPGLGQLIKGDVGRGIGFFLGTLFGIPLGLVPGLIVWLINIHDAYTYNASTPAVPAQPVLINGAAGRSQSVAPSVPQPVAPPVMDEALPPPPRLGARKFWGTVFILGALALLLLPARSGIPWLPGFLGAGIPMSLGGLLWGTAWRREAAWREEKRKAQERRWEKEILRCAQRHGGRLTAPQVVMETSLSLDEAKKHLEAMSAKGHVGISVSEGGALVYEFYEFAEDREQQHAERLLGPVGSRDDPLFEELRDGGG